MKAWPIVDDSTYRRQFCTRLALASAYAALTILCAVIGAKVLLTLAAVVTVGFAYEVVRFCIAYRQSEA